MPQPGVTVTVSPRIGSVYTVETSQTVRFLEWPEAATLGVARGASRRDTAGFPKVSMNR